MSLILLLQTLSKGQGIDTVYSFTPGTGQNAGQGTEYFPMNIFGFPSTIANNKTPANSPDEVLSLGLGGEIVVGFKNRVLIDRPGADFTVFENVFINPINQKLFVEPAKVAVSDDGINFKVFPYDPETLAGCAGLTPTYGSADPLNPVESGGDKFDIEDLGFDFITYIKITDITQELLDNPEHEYYDPILSGFDLDAVVGLTFEMQTGVEVEQNGILISGNTLLLPESHEFIRALVYDATGRQVKDYDLENCNQVNCDGLINGIYFLVLQSETEFQTLTVLIND